MKEQTISVCRLCLTEVHNKYDVPATCPGCGAFEPPQDDMTVYEHEMALKIGERLLNPEKAVSNG